MGYSTGRKPWRSDPPRELTDEAEAAKRKVFYLGLVVLAVFGVLTVQLARLQLISGEKYALRAENNRLRQVSITPPRGLIYDRHGVPLVENRASFSAAIVAADLPPEQETAITVTLQELLGVPAGEIAARVQERRRSNDPFSPVAIKENLSQETAFRLRERLPELPGVRVIVEPRREYINGPLLSHVIGFLGPIDDTEYAALRSRGYQLNDDIGKTGVEYTYESALRGIPGVKVVEADASGREVRTILEQPATPGASIVLSLDLDLQQKVTEFVQAGMGRSRNAAAVVMDVRTGEILALVSLPTYDNNVFARGVDQREIERLLTDPGKPLVNHAIAEMYPPGSTFKQITGIAALQEGIANASTRITSLGSIQVRNQYNPSISYTFKDWAALGTMDFYRGVAMSSDVYFYYLAGGYVDFNSGRDVFQGLGAARLASWARKFGLGAATGIDLPGESEGLVPDPAWKERALGEVWTVGDTYNMGIGQGYVATTPLQMLLVTAAIANGGDVLVPHVVREIRDAAGGVIVPPWRRVKNNLNVDPRNINIMREAMRQAVDTGTATTAKVRSVAVAGKTGTAEFGERRPDGSYLEHGWFTGFAPYDNPEIAVVVFLEQGGGALTAAPVAAKIFDYYFQRKNLAEAR
ncbi:MAG TPA: penicillin-binding protein 2 [Dehalococcoidia bacterium]|nr:penicillin-binding protein 2 [Dehalococcoidia bacterium]